MNTGILSATIISCVVAFVSANDRHVLSSDSTLARSPMEIPETAPLTGILTTSPNATKTAASENLATTPTTLFANVKTPEGIDDAWIQYSFDKPQTVSSYSLTAGYAAKDSMRPAAWELLASDDGENWVTLDIRCNAENNSGNSCISTRSLSNQNGGRDFAGISDRLFLLTDTAFLRPYAAGKYLIHSWHPDESKLDLDYNYWWMAHAIDAYVDAYQRTADDRFRAIANDIKTGMYTAYDSTRQDLWNSYFDDMEWMNLACIRAYESFPDSSLWLSEAVQLFDWIWQGWNYDNGSEGGIRWNSEDGTGKNSCSNAPAIIGAARLYRITGEKQYLDKATMIFDWMLTHSRFDDGFIKDSPGNNNRGWTFTYNQGTWIGGLLELYRSTKDPKYRDIAVDLIDKCLFTPWYSPQGILRESGWADGGMFKGIFIRYLTDWILSGYLDGDRQYRYAQYVIENARSLCNYALQLPGFKVMPDWKHLSDRPDGKENGRPDGYYCSTNLLSGIFLLESADKMRRAGLTDDDYNVINPYVNRPFRHYRIRFTDTHGSDSLSVGGFSLYE